jgi:hypothetical protein
MCCDVLVLFGGNFGCSFEVYRGFLLSLCVLQVFFCFLYMSMFHFVNFVCDIAKMTTTH